MSECEESRGNMLLTEVASICITTAKCSTVHLRTNVCLCLFSIYPEITLLLVEYSHWRINADGCV